MNHSSFWQTGEQRFAVMKRDRSERGRKAIAEAKVTEFIKTCIDKTNKKSVSRAAHIRKFKLLAEDFSIPGGELTPTLKLKRKVTETKYKQYVDEMFAMEAKL